MSARRFALGALTSVALGVAGLPSVAAERLPILNIDLGQTTVSGLSSGAYMAMQFHVAFSGTVRGAGIVAGGPYYCAEGQLLPNALYRCMQTSAGAPDPNRLAGLARGFARGGRIDPLENLADDRAYLFTGTNDRTVVSPVMDAARRFYLAAGLPPASLAYRGDTPAGHGMVTEQSGNACSVTAAPFINDCNLDLAGAILSQLYPNLRAPGAAALPNGAVLAFNQREFFAAGPAPVAGGWPWLPAPSTAATGLNDTGFAYVPAACGVRAETCRVHIVFHGCKQTVQDIQERYVRETGYNRWADGNNIVVLYPQARSEPMGNPNGCWDWWGYSGTGYATKTGVQMAAVRAMLGRLAGN